MQIWISCENKKKRIKWKGKSIRGVQCQVLAAYRKGYYCTPSQPIAENVGTSMNEDDRSHKLGDFFFLFFFFTLQAPPHTHTQFMPSTYGLPPWVVALSIKRSTTATGPSSAATKMFSMRCKATQIIVEISEYLLSNTIDEFYYAFLNARLC